MSKEEQEGLVSESNRFIDFVGDCHPQNALDGMAHRGQFAHFFAIQYFMNFAGVGT